MTSRDGAASRTAPSDCHGDIQHEKDGLKMRPRTLLLFALAALMGAAVAVLPALAAGPSEAKLEVNENCVEAAWPCWTTEGSASRPQPASKVTIAPGGKVKFIDHGKEASIKWTSTPSGQPTCSSEVPVSPMPAKTGWEGTCEFEQPGTYRFESSTLFKDAYENYTEYEIVVESASTGTTTTSTTTTTTPTTTTTTPTTTTTTTPTTPTTTTTTTPTTPTTTTPTTATPTATTSTQPSGGGASTATTPGSMETPPPPGGGSPLATLALANAQHGGAVHGTVQIPAADGGARLEIELLAQGASLAKVKRGGGSRVGRLVRSSAPAGTVSFTVSLDAQAKRALRRHHKLALTVKIVLTPKHGAALTLTRSLELRYDETAHAFAFRPRRADRGGGGRAARARRRTVRSEARSQRKLRRDRLAVLGNPRLGVHAATREQGHDRRRVAKSSSQTTRAPWRPLYGWALRRPAPVCL